MVTWRRCALFSFAAFLLGGAVASVALRKPARVEYREREVVKWREKEASTTNVAVTKTEGPSMRVQWRERVVTKPGGVTIVDRWHDHEDKGPTTTKAEEQKIVVREVAVDKIRDVARIETRAPTWDVSLMGGASAREPLVAVPGAPWAVLGLSVQRQIAGPFTAGAWVSSVGAAGVSIGMRW